MLYYKIWGAMKDSPSMEVIDVFETKEEAEEMLAEYRQAYGSEWSLWISRGR